MQLHGASAENLRTLDRSLALAVADGADGSRIGADLFDVAEVLRREGSLRRVVTDVAVDAGAKTGLVREVFGTRLGSPALELVAEAVRERWTVARDLADTLEHLGVVAVVRSATEQQAEQLVDELFAVRQLVRDNPELRDALADPSRQPGAKADLLTRLLEGRALPATVTLARHAVTGGHRTVLVALTEYHRVSAEVHGQRVAVARVARPLDEADRQRLTEALSRRYGQPVHLNEVVEPDMIAGVRVEIGDEVIDGAVSTRLAEAQRKLAG